MPMLFDDTEQKEEKKEQSSLRQINALCSSYTCDATSQNS